MQQIILLIINVIGGVAVIGSYIYGLLTHPDGANALWGNISLSVRPVYMVSMVLAALGYFAFIYFIFFRLIPDEVNIAGRFSFSLFYIIFLVILIPSVLWMPLSQAYIDDPGAGLWVGIRIVLSLVGISSIVLVLVLFNLQTKMTGISYWLAVAGSIYFAFHTAILDALLWPVLFK
ncbi:MAG: hypothetical protein PHQ86_05560 [Dehalococcoidales bacterium]|nr:hypothetical protein [Dehalococcoidales bacterium]